MKPTSSRVSATNQYGSLVLRIRQIIQTFKSKNKKLRQDQFLEMYWQIGRAIWHVLDKEQTRYGKLFYKILAKDVGIDRTDLIRCVQFFREYHVKDTLRKLTWTHYRILLTVKDVQERARLEQQAIKDNWSSRKLFAEAGKCKRPTFGKRAVMVSLDDSKENNAASFSPGWLFTYRVIADRYASKRLVLDLGFGITFRLDAAQKFSEGDFVSVEKKNGQIDLHAVLSFNENSCFTYSGYVVRVLEDLRLDILIDCGFGVRVRKVVSLRGVTEQDRSSGSNESIRKIYERNIRPSQRVVIKIHQGACPDQFKADLFYLKDSSDIQKIIKEGNCLNLQIGKALASTV